jgi:hypothetical protein
MLIVCVPELCVQGVPGNIGMPESGCSTGWLECCELTTCVWNWGIYYYNKTNVQTYGMEKKSRPEGIYKWD